MIDSRFSSVPARARRPSLLPPFAGAALLAAGVLPAGAAGGPEPRLTVYNQDYAIVTENRTLTLERGLQDLRIEDLPALLQPDSVILRDPSDAAGLRVVTQSFRSRALGIEEMLRRSEGKTLRFQVRNPATGKVETQTARLLRAGGRPAAGGEDSPVVETADGTILFSLPGEPVFDRLPPDAALGPHLLWRVETAKAGPRPLELSYATGGLSWSATYNAVLPERGDRLDLAGWVNVENRSGAAFRDARVRLLAGQVNRAMPAPKPLHVLGRNFMDTAAMEAAPPEVSARPLDEYHLYTLERPVTLEDGQSTQVEFRRAAAVPATRFYVYDGAASPAVRASLEFANRKDAGLGVPLPAGVLRVFREDRDGSRTLVGEAAIGHLPADETVRAEIGAAFDLVGERKAIDTRLVADRERAEEAYEIKLKNRRKDEVEIRVVERMPRGPNWRILEASDPHDRKDAATIEFRVKVPAGAERTVTYRVRYTW
jgi:hypothetical protein